MPSQEELRRRIVAARELRGITQTDLGALFEQDGLGKHDPGRIERGTMPMQRAHREAFIRHLRVPDAWFTEDDVDVLLGVSAGPSDLSERELQRAAELIAPQLLAAARALRQEPETGTRDRAEPGRSSTGGRGASR